MKKLLIFIITITICLPSFSQRLKVDTYSSGTYKKHYSHIIDGIYVNDCTHLFVGGNRNDKPGFNATLSGHKIYASGFSLIKNKDIDPQGTSDYIHLTDFTVHPGRDFEYGAGTGIYYPNGVDTTGYPFLGIYDDEAFKVDSFVYYNITFPEKEYSQAVGLRVIYSGEEEAYYICGLICDTIFDDIDPYDVDVNTKGFILKTRVDDQNSDQLIIFDPDSLSPSGNMCMIGDIEFSPGENRIAFTGINTIDDYTNNPHPMVGTVDMDLNLKWCYVYEIDQENYSGIDVEYNTDDTTILVLLNSASTWFAIMETNKDGIVLQGPEAYKFSSTETYNDTTRVHNMHYFNDTLIITGNHFANTGEGNPLDYDQYLFRFDVQADSLGEYLSDMKHFSVQEVPDGHQVPAYSYWAPRNSVFIDDSLYLVGVLYELSGSPQYRGFTFVREDGINPECTDTMSIISNEPQLDDTISCTGTSNTCSSTEEDIEVEPLTVSSYDECWETENAIMAVGEFGTKQEFWEPKQITNEGIELIITAEVPDTYLVCVYDMLGREVYNSSFLVNEGQTEITLNFKVNPEIYLIRVSNSSYDETKKIINNHLR